MQYSSLLHNERYRNQYGCEYFNYNSKYLTVYGRNPDIKEHMRYRVCANYFVDGYGQPLSYFGIVYIDNDIFGMDGICKKCTMHTHIMGNRIVKHILCNDKFATMVESFYIYMEE